MTAWALLALAGCEDGPSAAAPAAGGGAGGGRAGTVAAIVLRSAAFADGRPIPRRYTGDGEDLSPPLTWSGVPAAAVSLALVCEDSDAPGAAPWVHWIIYNVPAATAGLPEAVPRAERLDTPPGALQGRNSWPSGNVGYRGPAPPSGHGVHHYHFTLYALGAGAALGRGFDRAGLRRAIQGRVIGRGELVGTYER